MEPPRNPGGFKAQAGQVRDELGVDARLELEVELLDAPSVGEPGLSQPGSQASVSGGRHLFGHHPGQVGDMAPLARLGLLGQHGETLRRPAQAQVAEIGLQGLVGARDIRLGHIPLPVQPQAP